jgi:hypothetical protein
MQYFGGGFSAQSINSENHGQTKKKRDNKNPKINQKSKTTSSFLFSRIQQLT